MDIDLITMVNKLQETFNAIGGDALDLPQIVVSDKVGSQSSGKSSVLETIVGKDFLPRGQGIVTRRPLILQLIHLPPLSTSAPPAPPLSSSDGSPPSSLQNPTTQRDYGEFLHVDGRKYYDFEEIRKEIEQETLRVTGVNKAISKLPIQLKLYSERVLNLTLVDLPGLTKIPVGDQPSDIEKQIRTLVLDYISKPNCVILAISPANVDLANSDSLKLARSVDPQGRRTVGVLTKLDLMDLGTNAIEILSGRVYPLKLGFVGVVNRSQQDINSGKPMEEALQAEDEFFRNHPAYRNICHRCGTKYLAKTLNQVLTNHIREKMPDMKARLNTLMGQTQQELSAYGDATFHGEQHRGSLILKLMTQFVRDFVASIDGTSLELSTKELCGGARIYYIFNDVFGHALESINPTHNLTVQDIRTAIRNSTGPRPSLFVPEVAFDLLVKPQIKLLEPPSLRCVELVYEELMKVCHNCTSAEIQRYPRLHGQLIEVVSELLRERLGPTSEYVTSLIAIQAAYINTNHPAFVHGSTEFGNKERSENHRNASVHSRRGADNLSIDAASRKNEEDLQDDARSEPGDEDPPAVVTSMPNGRPTSAPGHHNKTRAVSTTLHDRSRGPSASMPRPTSPIPQPMGLHPSAASAKESFLNYFFGGGAVQPSDHHSRRSALPDLSSSNRYLDEGRRENPLAGRRGLEGSAAAFDMKSLEKHLEAPASEGPALSEREEMETTLIRALISSYFSIVRQTIQDTVPKAIMHLLVNFTRESVQNRLVASLYKDALFTELLYEDESLVADRNRVKAQLEAYKQAFKVLSEGLNP